MRATVRIVIAIALHDVRTLVLYNILLSNMSSSIYYSILVVAVRCTYA
jgi:hypothetical protein